MTKKKLLAIVTALLAVLGAAKALLESDPTPALPAPPAVSADAGAQ